MIVQSTFALPDLPDGGPRDNVHYCIAISGVYPPRDWRAQRHQRSAAHRDTGAAETDEPSRASTARLRPSAPL